VRVTTSFAENTLVVLLRDDRTWVKPSAEGMARLHQLLDRIRQETRAVVVDLFTDSSAYGDLDFVDMEHLSESGSRRLARALADPVLARLRAQASLQATTASGGR
jgi:hypothetical protein